MTRAILFDVDFTLIYPGPTFQGEGYRAFCAKHGVEVDAGRFERAVASAASLLELPDDTVYDDEIHVRYTRHIIQAMGGTGNGLDTIAREIYREWAACQHFELYDDVPDALRELVQAGFRIGLVSNSHRCLASFQTHFELEGLITAAVSSSEHGMMKPHPSIFKAALSLLGTSPGESLMVGDSLKHDIEGALQIGMRAALLHRPATPHPRARELARRRITVLRSLNDLPALLGLRRV